MSRAVRHWGCLALLTLAAAGADVSLRARGQRTAPSLETLFAEYSAGDHEIVQRTLRSASVARAVAEGLRHKVQIDSPREDRRLAVFTLEVALATSDQSPGDVPGLLAAARDALLKGTPENHPDADWDTFEQTWHETALALLQRIVVPAREEQYLDTIEQAAPARVWPRFVLARAVAMEQACWRSEPDFQPTTRLAQMVSGGDTSKRAHAYDDVVRAFDRAANSDDVGVRAEAVVRGAAARFRVGRFDDGLAVIAALDSLRPDRVQQYWALLVRARLEQALARYSDAADAYRHAAELYPDAQTATTGLAVMQFLANQRDEALAAAAASISLRPDAGDPWWIYYGADARFVGGWIKDLRGRLR